MNRICTYLLAAAVTLATTTTVALAQSFPSQPIRIINPFSPGGANDVAIRGLTRDAAAVVDQPILNETVTGAGGVTGMMQVAQAAADGYTLLVADNVLVTLPLFQDNIPVGVESYRPVGIFNVRGTWLLTRPGKGWTSLEDFVAEAKDRPGELTVGVPALASPQELSVIAIEDAFGIDVNIVPYGGGAPTMAALLGDQIDAAMPGTPSGLDSVQAGEAVFLVASTELELAEFPGELVSFADAGVDRDVSIWGAIWAPKDTPDDIMARLAEIFGEMAQSDAWREFATGYGLKPTWMPLEEAEAYIEQSAQTFSELAELAE